MPFTYHYTGIRQWERNERILTSSFGVNSLEIKKNKTNRMGVQIGVQKHANCFDQVFLGSTQVFFHNQLR